MEEKIMLGSWLVNQLFMKKVCTDEARNKVLNEYMSLRGEYPLSRNNIVFTDGGSLDCGKR